MRPRITGEILDDAWRMALADAPPILLFIALFWVPSITALLYLLSELTLPGVSSLGLAALTAALLSLTGLSSGACQELFRRRLANEPAAVGACLRAALRHGLEHTAMRAAMVSGPLIALFVLLSAEGGVRLLLLLILLPLGLALCACLTSPHVRIAQGQWRSGRFFRELGREVVAAPGKTAVIVFSRLPLLLLLVLQLHLLGTALLWTADNLAGLDTVLLGVELSLGQNPVYTLSLFLLSWMLLAPFFEASNCLLHADVRTRQEGLDLHYRVQRAFAAEPSRERQRVGTLLLIIALFSFAVPAQAAEDRLAAVRAVRVQVEVIREEVRQTEPYPGGQRWEDRLRDLSKRLARSGDGDPRRVRWFERAIADFGPRRREDALHVLDDLHRRLSLLEDSLTAPRRVPAEGNTATKRSPKEIKSLLRGGKDKYSRVPAREKIEEEQKQPQREEVRREEPETKGAKVRGGGGRRLGTSGGGGNGLSMLGWLLLAGLALAVLAAGLYLYLSAPRRPRSPELPTAIGPQTTLGEEEARRVLSESPDEWRRRADKLAEEGQFREAIRLLYLAVLSLLHQRQLIRFEPTRTNGEYVRQVRLSERAPPELHSPFRELTERFESNWYGEWNCLADDYRAGKALAQEMQILVQ